MKSEVNYWKEFKNFLKSRPNRVYISTFGIHPTESVVNALNQLVEEQVEGLILVGLPDLTLCTPKCGHCAKNYRRTCFELADLAERFPQLQWRFNQRLHMKMTAFRYKDNDTAGIIGGKNFGDSDWHDLSFIAHKVQIQAAALTFRDIWDESIIVTRSSIDDFTHRVVEEAYHE